MKRPRERDVVRTALSLLLSGLILACPFLCGAAEAGHVAHREHASTDSPNHPAPAHCPEDSDDCMCRGAVESSDVKVPDSDTVGIPLPFHSPGGLAHSLAHPLAHLTNDG